MIDSFVLLTPILVLAVLSLLRFVGCAVVFGLSYVPPQPGTLAGTFQAGKVQLTWEFDGEVSHFNVKRGRAHNDYSDASFTTVTTSFTDDTVQPATTFFYIVTAETSDGESEPSNEVVLIAPPTGLRVVAGDGKVDLSWDDYPNATAFSVKRGQTSQSYPDFHQVPAPATSYTDPGVINGTRYYYNLTVLTPDGESGIDPTIEVTAVPAILFVTAKALGATARTDRLAGMVIFTGSASIRVLSLGRYVLPGNSTDHQIKIVDTGGADLVVVTVSTAGAPADNFVYADLSNPIVLSPHVEYYVVSQENQTDDYYINDNGTVQTTVQTTADAGVTSAVFIANSTITRLGGVAQTFGPVDFRYVLA